MPHAVLSPNERVLRECTLSAYQRAVERAIDVMQDRLGEPLAIDDLAEVAYMSRYHFTRVFTRITGLSPARFLAALRIQEAKRLLLQTDRLVTDVSLDVGYNSLGTFTRIFADFVGYPPTHFRQLSRLLIQFDLAHIASLLSRTEPRFRTTTVSGKIVSENPVSLVTIAMFPTAVPKSRPIDCICLRDSLTFSFRNPSPGGAFIFAVGFECTATFEDALLLNQRRINVGTLDVRRAPTAEWTIQLRPRRSFEPPVVVAFPLLIAESVLSRNLSTLGEDACPPITQYFRT